MWLQHPQWAHGERGCGPSGGCTAGGAVGRGAWGPSAPQTRPPAPTRRSGRAKAHMGTRVGQDVLRAHAYEETRGSQGPCVERGASQGTRAWMWGRGRTSKSARARVLGLSRARAPGLQPRDPASCSRAPPPQPPIVAHPPGHLVWHFATPPASSSPLPPPAMSAPSRHRRWARVQGVQGETSPGDRARQDRQQAAPTDTRTQRSGDRTCLFP